MGVRITKVQLNAAGSVTSGELRVTRVAAKVAGQVDAAFEWLEHAFTQRDPNLPYLAASGLFLDLQDDPRTIDLLRRMGLRD